MKTTASLKYSVNDYSLVFKKVVNSTLIRVATCLILKDSFLGVTHKIKDCK